MLAALQTGKVDAAILAEPWVSGAVDEENNLLVFSTNFASQRTDVARRFMVGRLQAVRDYESGFFGTGDRIALVSILTKYTPITDPAVYERMSFSEMDPDGRVSADSLEQLQEWHVTHHYVATPADVTAAVDPSFAGYAISVLGAYQSR